MTRLQLDPATEVRSLGALLGAALALHHEARHRFDDLARRVEQEGEPATAATLRRLAEEAGDRAEAITAWARDLRIEPQQHHATPAELANAWDELGRSTLLTPYRVLTQAVEGERLVFSYFSYLAAGTTDPTVQEAAERLAGEALRDAARLRRWRREAWRREHRPSTQRRLPATTPEDLARLTKPLLAQAAQAHMALALIIADPAAAERLRKLAVAEADEAGIPTPTVPSLSPNLTPEDRRRRALMPLERLSELFEATASQAPNERLLAVAQAGLERTVARLQQVAAALSG